MTGIGAFRMLLAISRMARSSPPGVSRRMISPSAPPFADNSIFSSMYLAMGGVIAEFTVMTSKEGLISPANEAPAKINKAAINMAVRIFLLSFMILSAFFFKFLHNHLYIFPYQLFCRLVSQQIGVMESGHPLDAFIAVKPAAQGGYGSVIFKQRLGRKAAQSANRLRRYCLKLPDQKRPAGRNLRRFRIAVAGRPALQYIAYIDALPLQSHGFNDLCKKLAGFAYEGPALPVLVAPRRLADKYQLRFRIPFTEDQICALAPEGAG